MRIGLFFSPITLLKAISSCKSIRLNCLITFSAQQSGNGKLQGRETGQLCPGVGEDAHPLGGQDLLPRKVVISGVLRRDNQPRIFAADLLRCVTATPTFGNKPVSCYCFLTISLATVSHF